MSAKKATQQSAKRTTGNASKGFTDEERAGMRERSQELKAAARRGRGAGKADGESDVLAKIAEMPKSDCAMAERLHAIIKASAPDLSPRTWYGMPAYAKGGKVVCFFQSAQKFKTRYATFGFGDKANLDKGAMWPTAFALKELTAADEARIRALVKKAVSPAPEPASSSTRLLGGRLVERRIFAGRASSTRCLGVSSKCRGWPRAVRRGQPSRTLLLAARRLRRVAGGAGNAAKRSRVSDDLSPRLRPGEAICIRNRIPEDVVVVQSGVRAVGLAIQRRTL
jgi:hypothetical protein